MLEVILDTETTGLSTSENHRLVEIGCIELKDQIATKNIFHTYLNPHRKISEDAKKKDINKRLKKRVNFNLKIVKKLKKFQLPIELKKRKSDSNK